MVGEQLALSSQTQGVDTVTLEDADGEQRRDAHYHQRHEELVAAREFGDEEDARKRCMHHARNEARHPHQCKVLLRNIDTYLIHIPKARKEETGKPPIMSEGAKVPPHPPLPLVAEVAKPW